MTITRADVESRFWLYVFRLLDRHGWPLRSARIAPWLIGKAAGSKGVRVDDLLPVGARVCLAVPLYEDGQGDAAGTPVTILQVGPWLAGANLRYRRRSIQLAEPADYIAETDDEFGYALRTEHICIDTPKD